jgi:phage antirepressor YoqD-like protein
MDQYLDLIEEALKEIEGKNSVISKLREALKAKNELAEIGAAITGAGKWFTVAEAAKELIIPVSKNKKMGPNQLYAFLRNSGFVMRRKDRIGEPPYWTYHQPYQIEVDSGRMKLEERVSNRYPGKITRTTLISGTGMAYLQKRIDQAIDEGILNELIS